MLKRTEYKVGEFLVGIPSDDAKDYYKDTPIEEMVFIHNGYINDDGYGKLIGFVDGKLVKSSRWKKIMWSGNVRKASDEEKEKFIIKLMNEDKIK